MVIKPMIRNNICVNAHPEGSRLYVRKLAQYVRSRVLPLPVHVVPTKSIPQLIGQPPGEPPRPVTGRPGPEPFGQRLVDERHRSLLFR